jgi:hypothetical protein
MYNHCIRWPFVDNAEYAFNVKRTITANTRTIRAYIVGIELNYADCRRFRRIGSCDDIKSGEWVSADLDISSNVSFSSSAEYADIFKSRMQQYINGDDVLTSTEKKEVSKFNKVTIDFIHYILQIDVYHKCV